MCRFAAYPSARLAAVAFGWHGSVRAASFPRPVSFYLLTGAIPLIGFRRGSWPGEALMKLIEVLDDHDDVQNVYGNYELSEALMAKLAE